MHGDFRRSRMHIEVDLKTYKGSIGDHKLLSDSFVNCFMTYMPLIRTLMIRGKFLAIIIIFGHITHLFWEGI